MPRAIGPTRPARRRHHLYRHLRRGERRRHPHHGDHQHPRHQRCRGAVGRRQEPDRDQRRRRHLHLRHADHQRRRQPGHLRRPARHAWGLRHLRHRCRGPLDLHGQLVAGTTYTDIFDVVSADGTHTTVTINILGTNDAAVLSADVRNLTETNAAADISTSGTLTISDVDSPATFVAQPGTPGAYGTFAIDAAGHWTYTASSAHDEFVAGTTYTDVFD